MDASTVSEETTKETSSLTERLDLIRSSPKLQNQQQTRVVLSAVEDTLNDQKSDFTPTAYFAALLSLLNQYVSSSAAGVSNDVATAVVYLLDLVTPHVPQAILRSKFTQILNAIAPVLADPDAEGPFLRSCIGTLVSLLVAQDSQAWDLPQSQIGPRKATAALVQLAVDHRPKVRKRAQDGLATVLENGPPSPSLDHPAAEMCAETALRNFSNFATSASFEPGSENPRGSIKQHNPGLIYSMQLIKAIASATSGWPSKNLDSLCEVLFDVARSKTEYLSKAAFEVFEAILEGMGKSQSFAKLPRLQEIIAQMEPDHNDAQLLPPWIAVLSRAYDVSAQVDADETFANVPMVLSLISSFLSSSSYNIRVSASQCLISFLVNCIPDAAVLNPSILDEKTFEKLATTLNELLSVKYQASWMEVFGVLDSAFATFKWRAYPLLSQIVATVGELRSNESFSGKVQADDVLSKAIRAMGPENFLQILPLNLISPSKDNPGRAWLMPLLRDSISNTELMHFKNELVPLSEFFFQRATESQQGNEMSMEGKIADTLVQQIWATLPGYCDRPIDLREAFDQAFAEMISNILYQKPEMRITICKALQNLVDSTKAISTVDEDNLMEQGRISKIDAQRNIEYLSTFSPNMLAVFFNIYNETMPEHRGPILSCIDSFLSIASPKDLSDTFERIVTMLQSSADLGIDESADQKQNQKKQKSDTKVPMSHSLMDLVVSISIYLPREAFPSLFNIASEIVSRSRNPQLQKKAYKLIPRLGQSEAGKMALKERNFELRELLLKSGQNLQVPARKDRIQALSEVVAHLPDKDLYFIPSILPEVILATKEHNEKARESAYSLLISMGERMSEGGTIDNSKVAHMSDSAPSVAASIEEYLTMLSAGLAGTTPHMISASVLAISRVLFDFHSSLSEATLSDLLQTTELFLKSPSREIVRSVIGLVKVCIIVLPGPFMAPRLRTLIPALMPWSHEHKGHFKVRVKSILERMIRRYGVEVVERYCPAEDKKLVANIRKTRDRRKRKKGGVAVDASEDVDEPRGPPRESAFDEAVYGSDNEDEDDADSEASGSDDEDVQFRSQDRSRKGKRQGETYIIEDEDEPLDLLSRKALGKISSTRPVPQKKAMRRKAKVDLDGKLVLDGDEEKGGADDGDMDMAEADGQQSLEGGINAYVEAIRSRDTPQRGRAGRLKFSNRPARRGEDGDMDDESDGRPRGGMQRRGRAGRGMIGRGRFQAGGRGGSQNRGRGGGMERGRGFRVGKNKGSGRIVKRMGNKKAR